MEHRNAGIYYLNTKKSRVAIPLENLAKYVIFN